MARPGAYGLLETSTRASRACSSPVSSTRAQRRYSPAGTKNPPRRLRQGADLRVTISGLPDCLSVDAEGDVVQEEAAVHFAHVDQALHPISERVKGPATSCRSTPRSSANGCASPDADEGEPMRRSDCCYVRERPVAARHPERICALGHDLQDACPGRCRSRASLLDPCSRARSTILLRVAAPPPDLGLTNSTGRRGALAVRQPRLISVGSRGAGCGGRFMSQLPSSGLCASSLATLRLGAWTPAEAKPVLLGLALAVAGFARRSLGQGGRRTPDNASRHHHTHLTFAACGFH